MSRPIGRWLGIVAVLAAAGLCLGAGKSKERERFAEKLKLDPKTGQWIETPSPEAGTEDGDLDIARRHLAREEYSKAAKQVKGWMKTYGSEAERYPEALYIEGTAKLGMGEYRGAHDAYQALMNDFPGSVYAEQGIAADFRVAEQYLAGKRRKAWGGLLRIRDYDAGVKILDDVATNHPNTDVAELAMKTKADYYYRTGEFSLAQDEYVKLARDFPNSRFHPLALLRSAESALASFPGIKFDDAGLVESEERFTQFKAQYPEIAERERIPVVLEQIRSTRAQKEFETAGFYERTKRVRTAAFYYRSTVKNWPGTAWAAQAEARLAIMGYGTEPTTQPATAQKSGETSGPLAKAGGR